MNYHTIAKEMISRGYRSEDYFEAGNCFMDVLFSVICDLDDFRAFVLGEMKEIEKNLN